MWIDDLSRMIQSDDEYSTVDRRLLHQAILDLEAFCTPVAHTRAFSGVSAEALASLEVVRAAQAAKMIWLCEAQDALRARCYQLSRSSRDVL